jgi:hypothetical protein
MKPTVPLPRELVEAWSLFGGLSGTEWAVLLYIAAESLGGDGRDVSAGYETVASKAGVVKATATKAILSLVGANIITITREHSPTAPRAVRLNQDWRTWRWAEDRRAVARVALARYGTPHRPPPSSLSLDAQRVARGLRAHCLAFNAAASLPNADLGSPVWERWVRAMAGLMELPNVTGRTVEAVMEQANREPWYQVRIYNAEQEADRLLVRHFAELQARVRTS